jgi:HMG (high mobility group) box
LQPQCYEFIQADPEHEITNVEQILAAYEEPSKKVKKRRDTASLRKAPNAPKRFKSSYICFFVAKQPLIKAELGDQAAVTNISKRSAEMWKNLSAEERALWDDVAAKDKQRYMVEKAMYSGPWQVPWKRVKKDPSAPKRPMSAFLYYSQGKRADIKAQ